ncbi:RHS repeat-associated core domain-containing protein [Myceligenerans halotolerans]
MTITTALVATLLVPAMTAPASAAPSEPPEADLGTVVSGQDRGARAADLPELPDPAAPAQGLPRGGTATIPVAPGNAIDERDGGKRRAAVGGPTTVGDLPVAVTRRAGAELDEVTVKVSTPSDGAGPAVRLSVPKQSGPAAPGARTGGAGAGDVVVDVEVDYSKFAGASGGGYGGRLTLVDESGVPVETVNDAEKQTLTAQSVELNAAEPTTLAVAAATSGDTGDFGATPLSKSASWSTDLRSGSFAWNYPIGVPDVPGSFTPTLGLSYNSGGIDGRTSSTNNQGSLVGDGFDLWPGFIERKYKSCSIDDVKNDEGHAIGDQCWDYDNAHISFNGAAGELVPDGENSWRLAKDDGTKVDLLTNSARANGDNNNEYWRVTTPQGVKYYFGYHRLPGWSSGDSVTNSTWTVPVLGDDAGDPCHASTRAASVCDQAWRWNLDYAVDPAGNAISYYYTEDTNSYGSLGDPEDNVRYTRGGTLDRIDYGLDSSDVSGATPLGRVTFGYGERCIPGAVEGAQCDDINEQPNGWFDTPWDLNCSSTATCDNGRTSASFWVRDRLTSITTRVHVDGAFTPVDTWSLKHQWGTADTDYQLLLKSITRTGKTGHATDADLSGDVALPPVEFGYEQLVNRLDETGDGQAPFVKARLATVVDETGGQVDVGYSDPACQASNLPAENTNTTRCFPQRRLPGAELDPVTDWFNKYVVTSTVTTDRTGGAPDSETRYEYLGGGAWHWDESTGLTPDEEKTWSDWRGYGHVRTTTGSVTEQVSQSESWFLRGMDGDRSNRSGGKRSVEVSLGSGEGDPITDSDWLAGFAYKTAQFAEIDGEILSKTVNRPWWHRTAISERDWGTIRSGFVRTKESKTWTSLGTGGSPWRTTQVSNLFETTAGRITHVHDAGDTSVTGDERCSKMWYATNASKNILGLHSRKVTWAIGCWQGAPDYAGGEVVNDVRYAYDGQGYGAAPTAGRITRTADLAGFDGTTAEYVEASSTYDSYGRVTSVTDLSADVRVTDHGNGALSRSTRSDGRTTTTSYSPASGFATSMTETTPPATPGDSATALTTTTMLDPRRGTPTRVVDANGKNTSVHVDALGRVGKVWLTDRATTQLPSMQYTYRIAEGKPAAVGTTVLNDNGEQRTSWTIYDGQLRVRQTQVPGPESGRIISDTFYDARGLNHQSYEPYYNDQAPAAGIFDPYDSSSVDTMIRTDFDGTGRPTRSRTMYSDSDGEYTVGTTRWIYRGDRTTTIPLTGGTATTAISDARGQTIELRRHLDAVNARPGDTSGFDATSYTYTPRGELATVTDPEGNEWSYEFDQRGRQASTTDPDSGTTTSTYDDRGQLITTTNAENEITWHAYDGLGRPTEVRAGGSGGTLLRSWTYDTVRNGKGQPATATSYVDGNAYTTQVIEYDSLYRARRTLTLIPESEGDLAGTYITPTSYTVAGNLAGQPRPALLGSQDGVSVAYERDPDTGWITGTLASNGVEATHTYDYVGKLTQTEMHGPLSKSLWATNTYEDGTNRLSTYRIDRLDQPGVDRNETYEYDEAGNILSLTDVSRTGTEVQCFDYDHLAQLTEAWTQDVLGCASSGQAGADAGMLGGPAYYWHEWSYDEAGSRLSEVQHTNPEHPLTGRNYQYSETQPHAVAQVNQTVAASGGSPAVESMEQYTYDAVGRTTSRQIGGDTQTLDWGADGRLASVVNADGSSAEYVYDADGSRLVGHETDTNGVTTSTLYLGPTEISSTSTASGDTKMTQYVDLGDGHMAVVDDAGATQFVLADHHGTGQLTVNAADLSDVAQRRTTPFGTERGSGSVGPDQWPGTRGFVGGYDDRATTGLVSLGAREYDPALGRFISLDPVMDLTDPTQMHGYNYSNNNPTTLSDPDGLFAIKPITPIVTPISDEVTLEVEGAGTITGDGPVVPGPGPIVPGDRVGTTGASTVGPTQEEIAKAQAVMDKSVADVALELGWELLKDFVGYNDLMGCLESDIGSCAMLAIGITPWGKGAKAIKVLYKMIDGVISFYKKVEAASRVLARAGMKSANNETAGALTTLGKASDLASSYLDGFSAGQGFSGVYDEATGAVLAFPSRAGANLPNGYVPRRGGHAVVDARMTQAMGAPTKRRAGFTAILQGDGSLNVEWLSRSVNGRMGDPYVPADLRQGILDTMGGLTGRTVRGQ